AVRIMNARRSTPSGTGRPSRAGVFEVSSGNRSRDIGVLSEKKGPVLVLQQGPCLCPPDARAAREVMTPNDLGSEGGPRIVRAGQPALRYPAVRGEFPPEKGRGGGPRFAGACARSFCLHRLAADGRAASRGAPAVLSSVRCRFEEWCAPRSRSSRSSF